MLTVGHRTISGQISHVTGQKLVAWTKCQIKVLLMIATVLALTVYHTILKKSYLLHSILILLEAMEHVRSKLLAVRQPHGGDAKSLYDCLVAAMEYVQISDWKDKLVGFGCDGANVNIAAGGLRGYLTEGVPWIVVFWCLAHRLELALKDSLKDTLFSAIDEMLLRVYYLYHNSPKKCRELDEVVLELRMCLEELGSESYLRGNRPIRACGT